METKRNIILDGILGGSPEPILETAEMFRENGYFLQVSILAIPAQLSRFGIYKRYEDQIILKGTGRWVGMENHNRVYNELSTTLIALEESGYIDCIQVFTRSASTSDFSLLHEKKRKVSRWQWPPAQSVMTWDHPEPAFTALRDSRNRPWTSEEQTAFLLAVQAVAEQMRRRGANQADIDTFYRHVEWTS